MSTIVVMSTLCNIMYFIRHPIIPVENKSMSTNPRNTVFQRDVFWICCIFIWIV